MRKVRHTMARQIEIQFPATLQRLVFRHHVKCSTTELLFMPGMPRDVKYGLGIMCTAAVQIVITDYESGAAIPLPGIQARRDVDEENIVLLQHHTWLGGLPHGLGGIAAKAYARGMPTQRQPTVEQYLPGHGNSIFFEHARMHARSDGLDGLPRLLARGQHAVDRKGRTDAFSVDCGGGSEWMDDGVHEHAPGCVLANGRHARCMEKIIDHPPPQGQRGTGALTAMLGCFPASVGMLAAALWCAGYDGSGPLLSHLPCLLSPCWFSPEFRRSMCPVRLMCLPRRIVFCCRLGTIG